MDVLEKEITVLEDSLSKTVARRRAADMSIHSSEYLYSNLRFAMEHLDKAPAEAQITLLKALIKAIDIHDDHVIMRMYIGEPFEELTCKIDPKEQTLPVAVTSTEQGSPERQQWRRGRNSNPRTLSDHVFSRHARSTTPPPLPKITSLSNIQILK